MHDFWAKRGKQLVGPFPTREDALREFRIKFPLYGKHPLGRKQTDIMTGYGTFGPMFDIRWNDADDCGNDENDPYGIGEERKRNP